MTDPQPISVKANTYDDVFVDYKFKAGTYDIEAKIINTNIPDDNSENNKVVRKSYFVDLDTDGDNIGNKKDIDDDNDGLSDEEEFKIGTDSKKPDPIKTDTDADGVKDSEDKFPLDPAKWQASLLDSIASFSQNKNYLYLILRDLAFLVLFFLFRRKRRRKR